MDSQADPVPKEVGLWAWIRKLWARVLSFGLPISLLALSVGLYLSCYWYQSWSVRREAPFQYRKVIPLADGASSVEVDVTYPQTLWLDHTRSDQSEVNVALKSPFPTSTQPQTHTVSFNLPMTTVVAIDLKDGYILPRFTLTPTAETPSVEVFYLRRVLVPEHDSEWFTPTLRIHSSSTGELLLEEALNPIHLQSFRSAHRRQFLSLLLGPTTPLIPAAAGLVALAVKILQDQQKERLKAQEERRKRAEEARERRERREREFEGVVKAEISRLERLVRSDPSEGARLYLELGSGDDKVWQLERAQNAVEEAWKQRAPLALWKAVKLLDSEVKEERFCEAVTQMGIEESARALQWAYEHLDHEWRRLACDGILLFTRRYGHVGLISGEIMTDIERRGWRSVLRPWPQLTLCRDVPPKQDPEIVAGLDYLGLGENPFGQGEAETDALLLKSRIEPPGWIDFGKLHHAFVIGPSGSGKTATALLLAYDDLTGQSDFFPVYFATSQDGLGFDQIAWAVAQTLLHYVAVSPEGFLEQDVAGRSAMAHLLTHYVTRDLKPRFHRAGLPLFGRGDEVLREMGRLSRGLVSGKPLTEAELLLLLREARPHGFRFTTILLDVREQSDDSERTSVEEFATSLVGCSDKLARSSTYVKCFLPDVFAKLTGQHARRVVQMPEWPEGKLRKLLEERLKPFVQNDDVYDPDTGKMRPLRPWCNLQEGDFPAEDCLINAAHGRPGALIRKGDELLRLIGREQRLLREEDLVDVLGPWRPPSQETAS